MRLHRDIVKLPVVMFVLCSTLSLFTRAQEKKPDQQPSASQTDSRPPTVSVRESKEHLITRVDASYPPIAAAAHVSGVAVFGAEIDAAGNVTTVVALSGPEMLRAAAAEAVKHYKYRPFLVNGVPTIVRTAVQVKFVLGRPKSVE
ncbi:MAG: energy transducer TonB [Granulicella sp.]